VIFFFLYTTESKLQANLHPCSTRLEAALRLSSATLALPPPCVPGSRCRGGCAARTRWPWHWDHPVSSAELPGPPEHARLGSATRPAAEGPAPAPQASAARPYGSAGTTPQQLPAPGQRAALAAPGYGRIQASGTGRTSQAHSLSHAPLFADLRNVILKHNKYSNGCIKNIFKYIFSMRNISPQI